MSANHPTPGSTRCRHCLHHMAFSPKVAGGWCIAPACPLRDRLQSGQRTPSAAAAQELAGAISRSGLCAGLSDDGGMDRFAR